MPQDFFRGERTLRRLGPGPALAAGAWLAITALLLCVPVRGLAEETVTLNLKDADITAVIETVSEITGRNFIVDPRVKGKVTVISSRPLEADEVYQVFLSVLNVHGFAVVPGDDVEKIIPEVNAKQSDIPNVIADEDFRNDQYVTRVIQLENVPASQLVPVLRPLLPQQGHLAAYPESNVLIASATAANVNRIVQLVERIDRASDADVEVVRLDHASAEEVARIVTALTRAGGKGKDRVMPEVVADNRTNSVLLSGDKATRLRMRALIAHLDTPLEKTGNTRVIYLRYANAEDMVPVLTGVSTSITDEQQGKGADEKGEMSIQADKSTNSLVITAPPDVMRNLEAVIRQLDVRRAQVLVEAVVAEVSADTAAELGVQWLFDASPENGPVGLISFGGAGTGLGALANLAQGEGSPPDGATIGVGDSTNGDSSRGGAIISALAGDADTNILSTPTLVTMDNEEAEIVVGQNVPFVTGSYASTGDGTTPDNPFQTIQREDVGLTLQVKPQINEGDAVKLEIVQEVSSVTGAASGAADIVTDKRSIKSTVMVDDGEVVVLGGLIDDQVSENAQKVPGLGDIPGLGWLFSYSRTTKTKRNLMVFIRPVILRNQRQNAVMTSNKYNYIRAQQLLDQEDGVDLMRDDVLPVMPSLEEWMELPPTFEESKVENTPLEETPLEEAPLEEAPPGAGEVDGGTD